MTEEALRFYVDGQGAGRHLKPANQASLDAIKDVGRYVYVEIRDADPAHMDAHRFLFALLREMHENWPGNEYPKFEVWLLGLKAFIGAKKDVEHHKLGTVPIFESWSPYKLSHKRLIEIIDAVKQVCYDVLRWDEDVIQEAANG